MWCHWIATTAFWWRRACAVFARAQCRPGILALLEVASRQPQSVVAADLGFAVGPRINAAGRLEDMSIGIECLLCENLATARAQAVQTAPTESGAPGH